MAINTKDQFLIGSTVMGANAVAAMLMACQETGVNELWSDRLKKASDDFMEAALEFTQENKPAELR